MNVLTSRKPRQEKSPQEKLTAQQRLDAIDVRRREARAEANQLSREQQLAAQAATEADSQLITAEGRHGAGQLSDEELAQARKSFEAVKAEADRPWKRDLQVAEAKVAALEEERAALLSQHGAELATEVTKQAQAVRERIVRNHQERGEIAAEVVAVQAAWKAVGYTTSRFPLDNLAQEWKREARVFDPASIPLIVPEPRS